MYIKKETSEMVLLGLQRALDGDLKIKKRGDKFRVTNQANGQKYTVNTLGNMIVSCDCEHHKYRKVACKHMFAVVLSSKSKYGIQC